MTTTTEFTTQQYDESYPAGIEHHFWNNARNSIIARALAQADMATGNLLEIGCGRGIVLEHLRQKGMECIGCELANAPVPERLRPFVYTGTDFRSLPDDTRKRIDGVLLCDVIEHIPDAASFLGEIRTAFPRLRRVLVTVPARHELWSAWDEHYGHFRRYVPATLRDDFQRGGFAADSIGYFFHSLYAIMYGARRLRAKTVAPPRWQIPHRAMAIAFLAEYLLMPGWFPGTSLIAIASTRRS